MHRVSDQLHDRHPYQDLPFNDSYNPKEVTRAFGSRAVSKYAELLLMDDLSDEDRVKALQELHELLSNQETKYAAGMHEILFACADLTEARSSEVRMHAALVIASLVLYENDKPDDLGNETMLRAATALLSDPEEQVVAAACTIFRNLSISNQGVLLVASTVDVVEKITNILTSQPVKTTPMTILPVLVAILANVTRVFKGASVCSQFPVLAPVLEILKKAILYPSEMLLHAVLVIGNFATHDQGKREAISMGAVEICLKVLAKVLAQSIRCDEEKQVELARCLIGAIMGLSTYEEAKPRLLEYGVEPLVACLKHRHPSIKRNAIIAVNSACESPLGATYFTQKLLAEKALLVEVLGVKAIPALNKSLMGLDEDDKVCALDVLVDLCEKDADRATEEVVQCLEMLDNLIELAHDPQREIHQRATQVLHQMVKGGDGFVKRIGKKLQKHHASESEFQTIVGLSSTDFQIQYQ